MTAKRKGEVDGRLARIEGQLRGLRAMIKDDRSATEVLVLASSIRAAMDSAANVVVVAHAEDCLRRAARGEELTEVAGDLRDLVMKTR